MSRKRLLLVIDMISDWAFDGAGDVSGDGPIAVENINRIREAGPKTAFANDLSEGFHGSREMAFSLAMEGERPDLVGPLEPRPDEDFIHKGQHSAFYGTPLAHLLDTYEVGELILTGQVTEQCVLYSALDAHVRGYRIKVMTDAVLSMDPRLGDAALRMMETNMGAELLPTVELLERL